MQTTIDVEPRTISLINKAKELGISVDDVIQKALDETALERLTQDQLSPQAWVESFRNWTSQSKASTNVTEESLRRENIYED
ncbi:MAG: hypothetical protein KF881_13120 [Acidobacteria bacterium]|nr:hypothetical protein [Acidobacteriota bacterium]